MRKSLFLAVIIAFATLASACSKSFEEEYRDIAQKDGLSQTEIDCTLGLTYVQMVNEELDKDPSMCFPVTKKCERTRAFMDRSTELIKQCDFMKKR